MLNTKYFIVVLTLSKESYTWGNLLINFISFVFIFILIIVVAYFTTKFIGKKGSALIKNRNIKVVDKITLSMDKSIYIINIGSNYYLIASSKHSITLLDKLAESEVKLITHHKSKSVDKSFNSYLNKYFKASKQDVVDNDISQNKQISTISLMNQLKKLKSRKEQIKYQRDKDEEK